MKWEGISVVKNESRDVFIKWSHMKIYFFCKTKALWRKWEPNRLCPQIYFIPI